MFFLATYRDGISAQVSRGTVAILSPLHATVFGGSSVKDGSVSKRCNFCWDVVVHARFR
jgi:hypothetical protein